MSNELGKHLSDAAFAGLEHLLAAVEQTDESMTLEALPTVLKQIPVHERLALMTTLLPLLRDELITYSKRPDSDGLRVVMHLVQFVAALHRDAVTSPESYMQLDNYPTWAWPAVRAAQQHQQESEE